MGASADSGHPVGASVASSPPPSAPEAIPLLSQVLGRLLLVSPGLYGALLEGQPEGASGRFLDRWLQIASTRYLEEIIGVKTMAMLGRYRR